MLGADLGAFGHNIWLTEIPAICFLALVQFATYVAVLVMVICVALANVRKPKNKCIHTEPYTWSQWVFMGFRSLLIAFVSSAGLLCGAESVFHYRNLAILAMLGVSLLTNDHSIKWLILG